MLAISLDIVRVADDCRYKPSDSEQEVEEQMNPLKMRPRVLVVDDEKLIADTITEILEQSGFDAMAAYDGWAAVEAATKFRPDYLLTDVLMPVMNGVELAIAISKMLPETKILLFSGQAGIYDVLLEGHNQGYDFELAAKPIHPEKLIERLKSITGR